MLPDYFLWLLEIIDLNDRCRYRYKMLWILYNTTFEYYIPCDDNRASDGLQLRARYLKETGLLSDLDGPCSILEMMVALACRCELQIMNDDDIGDRTGIWFWTMIKSLGLYSFTDNVDDDYGINNIIFNFINRNYLRNGSGGLFTIKNPSIDMRTVEIWVQMNWWLNENYSSKV